MILPEIPNNDKDRLEALYSYSLLDTLPEKDIDNLTWIAAQICQTPISLVTLIDEDRQWFKSNHGMETNQTPRSQSFCAHGINQPGQTFIVPDSRLDDRFKDNPLVLGKPNIVFYAGVPIVNPSGHALGSLCVIDQKPKQLSDRQIEALESLANQVMQLFELRKNRIQLKKALKIAHIRNQELEQFAFVASHDLQEPLRTIREFTKVIEEDYGAGFDDDGRNLLGYVIGASQRMEDLIKALLAYSRLGIEMPLEIVDLNQLAEDLLKDLSTLINEHKASIQVDPLPTIMVSPVYFKMVLQNLVCNGIKFRKPDVSPEIKLSAKELDEHWQFSVSDNGIGIDKKHFDKIFKLFQRLHHHSEIPGSGIGLTHCKKIVELHEGQLHLESKLNEGSVFYFTIKKSIQPIE